MTNIKKRKRCYNPEICKKIGLRIKQLRNARNQSQLNFSIETEINKTILSEIEIGRRNITISSLDKILKALDISYLDFFDSDLFKN